MDSEVVDLNPDSINYQEFDPDKVTVLWVIWNMMIALFLLIGLFFGQVI